jgi:hypothetical protein
MKIVHSVMVKTPGECPGRPSLTILWVYCPLSMFLAWAVDEAVMEDAARLVVMRFGRVSDFKTRTGLCGHGTDCIIII